MVSRSTSRPISIIFSGIIPCGINAADGSVTSLSAELGRTLDPAEAKAVLAREFWQLWPEFLRGA